MVSKIEAAGYLASLVSLLDSFDDASRPRPVWLTDEYQRVWDGYKECVEKEQKEDAERREAERRRDARTAVTERRSGSAAGDDGDNISHPSRAGDHSRLHGPAE